jgi:membrane protein DedA with SNARE-associated domain
VLTISSGITRQPRAWFMGWIALAAIIWATYAAGLGYFGGKTFEDDHTKAFLVAFSAAIGITVIVEIVRHLRARSKAAVDVGVGS